MKYIHCDKCGKECPPRDIAKREGWFMSNNLSVSGIPLELICPHCCNKNQIVNNL